MLPIKEQPDLAFQLLIISVLLAVLIMGVLAHTMNYFKAGSLDLRKLRPGWTQLDLEHHPSPSSSFLASLARDVSR